MASKRLSQRPAGPARGGFQLGHSPGAANHQRRGRLSGVAALGLQDQYRQAPHISCRRAYEALASPGGSLRAPAASDLTD